MKILIVEDDKNIERILKNELEKWGYSVDTVDKLDQVTDVFKESDPQLVLMESPSIFQWLLLVPRDKKDF